MAGRPAYPTLNTSSTLAGRRAIVPSPSDGAPDSVHSRKRPVASGSRGLSPPEKRVRSAEVDRFNNDKGPSRPDSCTSQHTAPSAPSMRPAKQLDGCASGTINSLLAIKARKQAQALANGALVPLPQTAVPSAPDPNTTLAQSIAQMKAEAILSQAERKNMLNRIEELESSLASKHDQSSLLRRIDELESSLKNERNDLLHRIEEVQKSSKNERELMQGRITKLTAELATARLESSQKTLVERVNTLSQQVQKLQSKLSHLDKVKNDSETQSNKVDVLSRKLDLFDEKFKTLETRQEQSVTYSALESELSSVKAIKQSSTESCVNLFNFVAQIKSESEKVSAKFQKMSKDMDDLKVEKSATNHDSGRIDSLVAALESTRLDTEQNRNQIDALAKAVDADRAAASSMVKTAELNSQLTLQENRHNERLTTLEQNLETFADAQDTRLDKFKAHLELTAKAIDAKITTMIDELESRLSSHDIQFQEIDTRATASTQSIAGLSEKVEDMLTELANIVDNTEVIAKDQAADRARFSQMEATVKFIEKDIPDVCRRFMNNVRVDLELRINSIDDRLATIPSGQQQSQANAPDTILSMADRHMMQTIANTNTELQKWRLQVDNSLNTELQNWRLQVDNSLKGYEASIQDLTRMVPSMRTGGYLEGKIDILQNAITSLEDRYQNITSEFVYQQMVHWIAQMYPAAPDFLNQLREMRRDTMNLRESVQKLSSLGPDSQALISLLNMTDDLKKTPQLVKEALGCAKEATDKLEQNTRAISYLAENQKQSKSSLATVQSAVSKHEGLISEIQTRDSNNADSFAKFESFITSHEKDLKTLAKTLRDLVGDEKSEREAADASIKSDYGKVANDVRRLMESVSNLKKPVRLLETLGLEDVCTIYPQVVRFLYQLREAIEEMNTNLLPDRGLKFTFEDIKAPSLNDSTTVKTKKDKPQG